MKPRRSRRVQDSDEGFRFDASTSLREPDPVPIRPSRRVPQGPSGSEDSVPGPTRLHEEVIDPTRVVQSGSTSVVDMTVADSDPDSVIPHNRISDPFEHDFQQPCRRRTTRGVHGDDVVHLSLLDDLEHDLRPTPADDDSVTTSGNVTMMDTASDARAARQVAQVPARRGRRLRILGTQPTVEDLPSPSRFSPLEDDSELDTVSDAWEGTSSESETESLPDPEFVVEERRPVPAIVFPFRGDYRAAFMSLDALELNFMFEGQANATRSVPFLLRGAFRGALRVAMNEAVLAREQNDVPREERAWKLFFLLSRMLLTRPPPREAELVAESEEACRVARTAVVRKRKRGSDQERKAARAESHVMVGELSSARQVLESAKGTSCCRS